MFKGSRIRLLEEVKELAAHGFKEVILSGIHTASYGLDLEGNINLVNYNRRNRKDRWNRKNKNRFY